MVKSDIKVHKFKLSSDSRIKLREIRYNPVPDKRGFFVTVRWDTDTTLKLEKDAVSALKLFGRGKSLTEVAQALRRNPGEVKILIQEVAEAGFVKSIDQQELEDDLTKINPWRFPWNRNGLSYLVSKPLWLAITIFIVFGMLVGLTKPELVPSYKQYFWSDKLLLVYLSLFILGTLSVFLHETAHFLVTLAVGGKAKMKISHRFIVLVAETESYRLALAPKTHRLLVYLSGTMVNLIIIALIYTLIGFNLVPPGALRALLLAIVLVNMRNVLWQLNIFLQSDIYNYFSDFLENDNLHNNASSLIAQKLRPWKKGLFRPLASLFLFFLNEKTLEKRADALENLDADERRQIALYCLILFLGLTLVSYQYLAFLVPRDIVFISGALGMVGRSAINRQMVGLAEGMLLFILVIWKYAAVAIVFVINRRRAS